MNARIAFVALTMAGCGLGFSGENEARADSDPPRAQRFVESYYGSPRATQYYYEPAPSRYRTYRPSYDTYDRPPYYAEDFGSQRYESDWRYVAGLYREILQREGSPPEIDAWVEALARGGSRSKIRRDFLTSPEYRRLTGYRRNAQPLTFGFEF